MDLLAEMRQGAILSVRQQILLIIQLSIPAIMAQVTSVIMQYIDASMVGQLGANDSASIGLVGSSTWLIGGLMNAVNIGFYVQIAHRIGAGREKEARDVMKHGLLVALLFSAALTAFCMGISGVLPVILGGGSDITPGATIYFRIFASELAAYQLMMLACGMVQSSGNMKMPSFANMLACILDVVFNLFLIFPTGKVRLFGLALPGAGLGIAGAALGTALSEVVCAVLMLYFLLFRSPILHLRKSEKTFFTPEIVKTAFKLTLPAALESFIMGGAQVASTMIVAPLGTISIAANSFAVTAESLCYMPGYGIQSAAVTLIGQSYGAKRTYLTRKLGWLSTGMGMIVMAAAGVLMYVFAPEMIGILTPDPEIRELGAAVLRIEAFAEPMFGASIVAAGVFRGTGDTLAPTIRNLASMWCIRIPLAFLLSRTMGLRGVWTAMCIELSVRGALFLIHLAGKKWAKQRVKGELAKAA